MTLIVDSTSYLGFGFGFEPVLSNLRNTPTQLSKYSYRRYLKGFGLSIVLHRLIVDNDSTSYLHILKSWTMTARRPFIIIIIIPLCVNLW
jgi:hypothetical protein